MDFLTLRNQFFESGYFNLDQLYSRHPGFDMKDLRRWVNQKLLIKLRNSYYGFSEYLHKPDFSFYIANNIYRPSYISLHTALAFYGMIPESKMRITSISSLKTMEFINDFGRFSFKTVLPEFMFGYDAKPLTDGRTMLIAKPEKAILDLLYLYKSYRGSDELYNLRFDDDFMQNELNVELLKSYTDKYKSKALDNRVNLLIETRKL